MIRICKIDDVKGNEVLAKEVMTVDYKILLNSGEKIQPKQIDKLKEFGIKEICIKVEDDEQEETVTILKEQTRIRLKSKVTEILQKHTYGHNEVLREMQGVANRIIDEVISTKGIAERVFDIKERDASVYDHSLTVCVLSILTAIKLNVSKEKLYDIATGSLLHDIGLQYLPMKYENKELGEYTSVEKEDYKKHPIYGYSVLSDENWLSEISKKIVLYHHERMDGSGYPMQIRELQLETSIVQVCDSFDEMICGIGYRKLKVYEAIEFLKISKRKKFKEQVVDAFLEFVAVYPVGTTVKTNSGEVGVVLRQNKEFPDRPVIKIIKDKNGNTDNLNLVKDLLHENTVFIEGLY